MTGRELLAALQALSAEQLDLPIVMGSNEGGDPSGLYPDIDIVHDFKERDLTIPDWTAPGAFRIRSVLWLSPLSPSEPLDTGRAGS